jgi:hypothetical protein
MPPVSVMGAPATATAAQNKLVCRAKTGECGWQTIQEMLGDRLVSILRIITKIFEHDIHELLVISGLRSAN